VFECDELVKVDGDGDSPIARAAAPAVPGGRPPIDPRALVRDLAAYRHPRTSRSVFELGVTMVPFLALCGVMLAAVKAGYLVALVLTVPAGLLLLRLFLIQHDCGHGAFLSSRRGNDWIGRILGVLTLTPYACWRRAHALHHASTGNLDARGFGDVDTLTVREFNARTRWGQRRYRFYRHPLVLFGLGPAYLFLLRHRLPIGLMREKEHWVSAIGTTAAAAVLIALLASWAGLGTVLLVQLPVTLLAGSIGVWLFYIQHQFEQAHWDEAPQWSFHEAALHGSSHLELPGVLRWFTANIGVHHVHHLASRIPYYRLPEVLRDHPGLCHVNRLTPAQTLSTFRLALWDEEQRRMISFKAARQAARA
jgi:acyl-lipid omega-6 desaturase (Delta-12 desaturase)